MGIDLLPASDGHPLRLRNEPGLVRLRRGWYADRAAVEAVPEHSRYPLVVRAVAAARPSAILARESTLALSEMPFGRPDDVFTIGDPNMPGRLAGVCNSHVRVVSGDILVEDGIARCAPAYALAHLARLGRQVDAASALHEALREHIDTLDWMWEAAQHPRQLGSMLAQASVPIATHLLPGW